MEHGPHRKLQGSYFRFDAKDFIDVEEGTSWDLRRALAKTKEDHEALWGPRPRKQDWSTIRRHRNAGKRYMEMSEQIADIRDCAARLLRGTEPKLQTTITTSGDAPDTN
jgi:hypothetical protein